MDIRQKTVDKIREFNRFYTAQMNLLNSKYLLTAYSLAEIRVLFEIWINETCIQDNLVQSLCIDKSYLSRILKKLEKSFIIEKHHGKSDKRNWVISLSEIGKREVIKLTDQTNVFIAEKISNLDDCQCAELCESLSNSISLLKKAQQDFKVVPFEEKYRKYFIDFNTDWITTYFGKIEEHDLEEFENIDKDIEKGGMIFFAVKDDIALATCMTKPLDDCTWEICKLGSNKRFSHKGAGSAVFEASMKWALGKGAKRLFIISNSVLKPAIHIYRKFGFEEIKLDNYQYERGDIAFEYIRR